LRQRVYWLYSIIILSFILCLQPAQANHFTLLHSAGVNGLASNYHYGINQPYILLHKLTRQASQPIKALQTDGASVYFYNQGRYIWAKGMGVADFHNFLAKLNKQSPFENKSRLVLDCDDSIALEPESEQNLSLRLKQQAPQSKELNNSIDLKTARLQIYPGQIYLLEMPQAAQQINTDPEAWEMLLGLQLSIVFENKTAGLLMIGKPNGDGARRMALLKGLQSSNELLVDSGNLLEGLSSVNTASLSLQRSNSLKAIQNLGYFALNIGAEELRGGLDNLLREQEQYQLPLISASLSQKGHPIFEPYKLVKAAGKTLALIGIGNSDELEHLQETGILGPDIEIAKPSEALKNALAEIEKKELKPPDSVILLTTLQGQELENLAQNSPGIDLILGDIQSPLRPSRMSIERPQDREALPFIVPNNPHAQGLLQLRLESGQLQIQNEVLPISFDTEPDPDFLKNIMQVRQMAYRDALGTLLPNLGPAILAQADLRQRFLNSPKTRQARKRLEGLESLSDSDFLRLYPPRLTADMWGILISNILLQHFNTEVTLIGRPSDGIYVPGAWPRLLVYELLKGDATLELYYLNGTQLKALLQLPLENTIRGGISADQTKVWNRPLQNTTYYRTLISSDISRRSDVHALIKNTRQEDSLKNPFEPQKAAEPLYLRDMLLRYLEQIQDSEHSTAKLLAYLEPQWEKKQALWSIQVSDLQLNLSGYNAFNNQNYSAVRETRVTSPNSFTSGGRSKLALIFDSEPLTWSQSVQAKYEGLSLLDASSQQTKFTESQDDLVFASELQLLLFEFPFWGQALQLIPYLEGAYDTEFTPTVQPKTQLLNPRQSELSGVFGLSIPPGPILKAFKTGLALRRDFNVPNNFELGLQFKLDHEYPLTPYLRWANTIDLKYYLPSPNDNSSSLGLATQWTSALKVSLTDNLALRFFADAYIFQGKLPSTSELGSSIILGIGLSYDRLWKPIYEPLL
jgi:hypothetical protein